MTQNDNGDTEHFAYSQLTDTWYRVFDYEDRGNGRIVANGKGEVDENDVPKE